MRFQRKSSSLRAFTVKNMLSVRVFSRTFFFFWLGHFSNRKQQPLKAPLAFSLQVVYVKSVWNFLQPNILYCFKRHIKSPFKKGVKFKTRLNTII